MVPRIAGGSLIQGTIGGAVATKGDNNAPNLEAVILVSKDPKDPEGGGFNLYHYWRDQVRPDRPWRRGALISGAATGPGCICQRRMVGDVHGNFEVLVPEAGGIAHYWWDNAASEPAWKQVGLAAPGATGPAMVVENRRNQNLEAVALHGRSLVHHWFDGAWHGGSVITDHAYGAPALIQSSYDDHLEVIVVERGDLVLYWLDGFGAGARWRSGGLITNAGDGPVGFVQGRYGSDPHRNFELAVPRRDALYLYWRENDRPPNRPWRPGGLATWGAGPVVAVSLVSSYFGDGWLQALTQEATSIYHLHRQQHDSQFRWMRSACLRLDDTAPSDVDYTRARSVRVAQITGERDLQHQHLSPPPPSLSRSQSVSGIRGTDLGVTVHHDGRTLMLFGDTHWQDGDRITLDAIAEIRSYPTMGLPEVELHGSPLEIVGEGVTMREYDVPLDAFSLAGQLFVFFTSGSFDRQQVMGRSVLTRALDPATPIKGQARSQPLRFQLLSTFSTFRFINVSTQLMPASAVPDFGREGHVLLIWGSGAYRADDLRLALLDLRDPALSTYLLDDRPFPIERLGVRYFAGFCGAQPIWSAHEEDARPLFYPDALGELSVRWVPEAQRFILLAMSGPEDPIGLAVTMRTSPTPWGPWSRRRQIFDWYVDGRGIRDRSKQFIHDVDVKPPDTVGDSIFPEQANSSGAAYAPYLFDAGLSGERLTLRYTLSTWNPYQVMLMSHDVSLQELHQLES
jgi:Domain of unknown function (DUF4185)